MIILPVCVHNNKNNNGKRDKWSFSKVIRVIPNLFSVFLQIIIIIYFSDSSNHLALLRIEKENAKCRKQPNNRKERLRNEKKSYNLFPIEFVEI